MIRNLSHGLTAALVVVLLTSVGDTHAAPDASAPPVAPPIIPTVTLDAGRLEGVRGGDGQVMAFLGIPYAAPPVGALRWSAPRPVAAWSGTRKAAAYGPSCPQLPARWLPDAAWNEDCLFLNVFTTGLPPAAKRPVILWLHGGSNRNGNAHYNRIGEPLARQGAVVVSINYRLGPLGFLAHPALSAESPHHASGNYGLLDQLQALRWVRDNISRFGGDPQSVTLMGQSAGAYDACLLMASPLATGLFHRAILQSGDCQGTLNMDLRATLHYNALTMSGEGAGERLVRALEMGSEVTAARLRGVAVETLLKAWAGDPAIQFDAVVDGWILPAQPAAVFAEGKQAHVPVIVGSNVDEATIFGSRGKVTTVAQFKEAVTEQAGKYANTMLAAYPAATDADVPARYLQLMTDSFGYGAQSLARRVSQSGSPSGSRAYFYCFSYSDTGTRGALGAHHGLEMNFLAGEFPNNFTRTPAAAALGETMRRYWVQFAKTGNPNAAGLPEWVEYDPGDDRCLDLGRTIAPRAVPHGAALAAWSEMMQHVFEETGVTRRGSR